MVEAWLRYYPCRKGEPLHIGYDGPPPLVVSPRARVAHPPPEDRHERALRLQASLDLGAVRNRTELARIEGVSKPMITKILKELESPLPT